MVPQEIADHDLISIVVDVSKPKRQPIIRTFRHLGNYSSDAFCSSLLQSIHCFNRILLTDDVNTQVDIFTTTFIDCLNECAPFVTKEVKRPFAQWMNDELRGAMRIRNNTRNQLKRDRNNIVLQDRYKQEKKSVKSLIEETKAQYYHNVFNENKGNTSKIWKTIREIVPSRKTNSNTDSDNTEDKANEFNKLFANVGKNTFKKLKKSSTVKTCRILLRYKNT